MHKIVISPDNMRPIPRAKDASVFIAHWSGGVQTAEISENNWRITPILYNGKVYSGGMFAKDYSQKAMLSRGLKFIAFQQMSWSKGQYSSRWAPFIRGEDNFSSSPADVWSRISSNIGGTKRDELKNLPPNTDIKDIEKILDTQTEPERLARSVSLSLRNMDVTVENISEIYHEELTNALSDGGANGLRRGSSRDQSLYAHVHSFFLHLGAARDYLAAFIAHQLDLASSKDSMTRLVDALRGNIANQPPIFKLMEYKGYIKPIGAPSTKWKLAGWLDQVTDLRNEFVHHRTYGHKVAERMGHLRPIDPSNGLYRYFRPVFVNGTEMDVLDLILDNYEKMNELFFKSARVSGFDSNMMTITEEDIISIESIQIKDK